MVVIKAVDSTASKQASKQAIFIISHEVNSVFTSLLQMLDHPKIDIFIHMDAKNKSYDPAYASQLVKYSRVIHTPRIKVSWGAFSLIKAELLLLEAATSQGHYEHYHLISGADLPVKKVEDLIAFFEEHFDTEFVNCGKSEVFQQRVKYYYPLQEIKGRTRNVFLRVIAKLLFLLQKAMFINRNKEVSFMWGSQWFSITDEFARYVLTKREWIYKTFHHTLCCDESFLQTILFNSEFRNNLVRENVRLIDWKRGCPYTFTLADLDMITSSKAMFARKFHPSVDQQIIDKIRELYS